MSLPNDTSENTASENKPINFIRQIINEDLSSNKHDKIITRFPPEPNGYLHIGHAKSICLNFGIAQDYNGICSLRFDDTNPAKEEIEYINSIKEDVKWLNFDWQSHLYHASDYFDSLYQFAIALIKDGKAYIDTSNADEIREMRGTLTKPGIESPFRNRPIDENLSLFEQMRAGDFPNGGAVLRAKIDMQSPNINMRDPILYRVLHTSHPITGDKWCIYPMYDYTHALSDAIENVTHSLCTLEFEDHRPLYNWCVDNVRQALNHINEKEVHRIGAPRQIEFSRLNLEYTITSKRKLTQLVQDKYVDGWNDPRMPTISGLRRRGYTPASIRDFCERIGITKSSNTIEMSVLENSIRQDLENSANRALVVIDPIKLIISNYPDNKVEEFDVPNHPQNPEMGTRKVPFSKVVYIEREDFMENAPKKFFRLTEGREVRLKYAYYVTCDKAIKDDLGNVVEVHCTYDPESSGGWTADERKVKGTIHWVSVEHAIDGEVREYDRLFTVPHPDKDKEVPFTNFINDKSLVIFPDAKLEPSLASSDVEQRFQFERKGYFCLDSELTSKQKPVFNRIVSLRDTWAKKSNGG